MVAVEEIPRISTLSETLSILRQSGSFSGDFWREIPGADVRIITSCGRTIPAHADVLASTSPVLENLLQRRPRKRGNGERKIPILGVPFDAVVCFLRCLYSSRCPEEEEEKRKYGVHLLVLSHVMQVPWLKRATAVSLAASLTVENVVDMLQLARQCDAPRLKVRCMGLLRREFKAVEETEGWRFVQENDPWLELEVLEFLQDEHKRQKSRMRKKEEQRVYMELTEAMECLQHICTEGCTSVRPRDAEMAARRGPCQWGRTCQGVQQLIQHFAACEKKKNRVPGGGCQRCARMWQLLRLHSAVCDQLDTCKVPLCKQFKEEGGVDTKKKKRDQDMRWGLLAKKVVSAKVIYALSKRKREEDHHANA